MKLYFLFLLIFYATEISAFEFSILSWNVESDNDTNPKLIAEQLKEYENIDFLALSEVHRKDYWKYFQAVNNNKNFSYVISNSGTSDKLQIIYNQKRFELLELHELMKMTFGNPHLRGALIGHFRHRKDNTEFYLMLNHLYRSDSEKRHEQSRILHEWVTQQRLPIIAVGDYNYDWQIKNGKNDHDKGFDIFTSNSKMFWLKPKHLIPTHCDERYETIIDFVFLSNKAKNWQGNSRILHPEKSFCDNEKHGGSDHRPVLTKLIIPKNN